MFERYCFTRSKSSIMSSSLLLTMLMLASMSLMLDLGRCTLKMNWKQKAPQTPPRIGPTQNTLRNPDSELNFMLYAEEMLKSYQWKLN